MKTCKYGCGKMKDGGKVTAVKKMAKGGSTGCPPGQCAKYVGGKREGCEPCKAGVIAGITAGVSGALGVAGKMISDAVKAKKAKKKEKEIAKNSEEKRKGGSVKKYAVGGNTGGYAPAQKGGDNTKMGIYGIPNAGRTDSLGFKKGGSTTNRAVSPGCRGGMVKDASGKCVNERPRFKKGGFPDLNKDGKVTRADILKGRGVIKKMGGAKKR
jgi:hypothetical protein